MRKNWSMFLDGDRDPVDPAEWDVIARTVDEAKFATRIRGVAPIRASIGYHLQDGETCMPYLEWLGSEIQDHRIGVSGDMDWHVKHANPHNMDWRVHDPGDSVTDNVAGMIMKVKMRALLAYWSY